VRLWTAINGKATLYNDYFYTESSITPAAMTSPANGSTLTGASTTFKWTTGAGGVTGYYLWIGTTAGAHDLLNAAVAGTSYTATVPTTGATIYVRLWTAINGKATVYNDYTYVTQ
jgi:hypothetical protein